MTSDETPLTPTALDELCGLVVLAGDRELTEEQIDRLEELVTGDDQTCLQYAMLMHVQAGLWRRLRNDAVLTGEESRSLLEGELRPGPRVASPVPGFLGGAWHDAVGYFSSGWPVAYLVATVVFGIGLLVGTLVHVSHSVQVARQPATHPSPVTPLPSMVGRITGMVDCQWADEATAAFSGAHVPLGRRYALASGLMEITYDTGAKVILQGPVTYEVESAAGGYLAVGRLTARLEKGSGVRGQGSEETHLKSEISGPRPLTPGPFAIRTPTATVTDLGTEFGVEVSKEGQTTSHVFRGSVRLQAASADGKVEGVAQVLHENESARVEYNDTSGKGHPVIVAGGPVKAGGFVRALPKRTVNTFDLVDVVAGGDGFSGRRGRGIDPTTGHISRFDPSTFFPTFAGDHQYHRTKGLSLVDGVFIPDGRKGSVQVDSAGHTFKGFDKTDNLTHGHIWAGGPIAPADVPQAMRTNLRDIDDYASAGHGLILLRANSGITFDLDAIRQATGGGRIVRFSATGANTATFADVRTINADLFVLVDGKQRFVRRQEAGWGGRLLVAVPLADEDRFLTLAFTDGGDGCGWDWTILGDPRLEMVVTESGGESGANAKAGGQEP